MKRVLAFLLVFVFLFSFALPSFATGEGSTVIYETDLSPVTSWLHDIFNSLGSLGDHLTAVKDWLFNIADSIGKGFNILYDQLQKAANNVISKLDSFKTAVSNLFEQVKIKIGEVINHIKATLSRMNSIFDEWKNFFISKLEYYFLPTTTFNSLLNDLRTALESKFSGVLTIKVIFDSLKQFASSDVPPEFSITYKGTKVNIINFAPYDAYRPFVHNLILFFAWFAFLRRLYHSFPSFVMNAGGYDGSSRSDRSTSTS